MKEGVIVGKKHLEAAKSAKNDEFYTQLSDIENELKHYIKYFRGKVVYCNCDDPGQSNFWRYFHLNFTYFGLKKLIATHYRAEGGAYTMEYTGENDLNIYEGKVRNLKGTGDFRDEECIEVLKQADIVCTNPPFSLFREYLAQLIEYKKDFLILGNMNALTYKDVFPLFKDNKVWYGPSISSGDRNFNLTDYYELMAAGCGVDEDGRKFIKVKGVRWFTNLDHSRRHEPLELLEHYTPEKYPKYDNYDAINIDRVCDIPMDYEGVIGVPITFMDKYCHKQFEILGTIRPMINEKFLYKRILIRKIKSN